uniref:Uncharacterized protein n=1 Tax=Anguilla anguilla TaxID=7936 RepID=A0A0E9UDP6_ANGAN
MKKISSILLRFFFFS